MHGYERVRPEIGEEEIAGCTMSHIYKREDEFTDP